MAAIDFPSSPSVNDIVIRGGYSWIWTGDVWKKVLDANQLAEGSADGDILSWDNTAGTWGADTQANTIGTYVSNAVTTGTATKKTEIIDEISANQTLVSNTKYFVDTSAARTLALPSSPSVGDEIWIIDQTSSAAANNITVTNGGSNINGVDDSLIIDVDGAVATLLYTGSTLGWRI